MYRVNVELCLYQIVSRMNFGESLTNTPQIKQNFGVPGR